LGSSRLPLERALLTETEVDELRSNELRISCEGDVSGLGSVLVRLAILKPVE